MLFPTARNNTHSTAGSHVTGDSHSLLSLSQIVQGRFYSPRIVNNRSVSALANVFGLGSENRRTGLRLKKNDGMAVTKLIFCPSPRARDGT